MRDGGQASRWWKIEFGQFGGVGRAALGRLMQDEIIKFPCPAIALVVDVFVSLLQMVPGGRWPCHNSPRIRSADVRGPLGS